MVKVNNYEAPFYAVFSLLLLLSLVPNILSTLLSNSFIPRSSLCVGDYAIHPPDCDEFTSYLGETDIARKQTIITKFLWNWKMNY
jgi:hypothetical protein